MQLSNLSIYDSDLITIPDRKLLINTINAHCYNIAQKDELYAKALSSSDILLPDGISIVFAIQALKQKKISKIAGADLFYYEMNRLNQNGGKCFFLGSNTATLNKITTHANKNYPHVKVYSYSPPYAETFTEEDNKKMVSKINAIKPDVLFVGMTAPKQEKWAFMHFDKLEVGHIGCIGAVFDFFAGNIKRAPQWMINLGLEWFYRFIMEPGRLWHRYIIGNIKFIYFIIKERLFLR